MKPCKHNFDFYSIVGGNLDIMLGKDCCFLFRYEMKEKGLLKEEDSNTVPDIYVR